MPTDRPPGLVDTHCHLELIDESSPGEAATALSAAARAGVGAVINIGLGPDNAAVVARADRGSGVYAAVGWHPHQDDPPSEDELAEMEELARCSGVVAIGEIGLDYYWRPGYHEVPASIQKDGFRRMLALALDVGLPVIIHDREAHADVLEILREFPGTRGAIHAFSGDTPFAQACVEAGMHIAVAGPVTYPRADALREAVTSIPLSRLLVETDAPFLPPQPWRGKPNRPEMMVETVRRIAEVRSTTLEAVAAATTGNAERLFGVALPG